MTRTLIDLSEAADAAVETVGGKARHLGLMHRLGLPVPQGFVVTAQALARGVSKELRDAVAEAIALRNWQNTPLAVRSSAPQEDSATVSFAGIYRSELNVCGLPDLFDAIGIVVDSLSAPQAVAYRDRQGITEAGMAVLIMPMVPAQAAGIAFTCDPQSGREDRVVINAVRGLADTLVSGAQTGDQMILEETRNGENLRLVSIQRSVLQEPPVLAEEQILELGRLLREAAQALDYADPVWDFEWVWDGSGFWLVQARPVTARRWHTYAGLAGQEAIWSNGNTRDVTPYVMRAMDWSSFRTLVDLMLEQGYRLAGYPLLPGVRRSALLHGRLYLNTSFLQWEGYDALGIEPAVMNALIGGHHPEIEWSRPHWRERLRRGGGLMRYLARAGARRRLGKAQAAQSFADAERWRGEDSSGWSDEVLIARVKDVIELTHSRDGLMFLQGSGGGNLYLLLELIGRYLPEERHALVSAIMTGGEPSVTAQQAYALQDMARLAANDAVARAFLQGGPPWDLAALAPDNAFRQAFEGFVERYGHRGIYESYLSRPRFRENQTYLFDLLVDLLDADPEARERRIRQEAEKAWEKLSAALPKAKLWWARKLVVTARRETNDRELARSALIACSETLRRLLLEMADRLCRRGLLERREDVFDLSLGEATAALVGRLPVTAVRARVAHRQAQWEAWDRQAAPEVIIGRRALPPAVPKRSANGAWMGTAVGYGCAEGVARIVHSPDEGMRLTPEDILVAPSTDPAWTPLFLCAGGLVMETGGYLSHGAIVARELGIPAVVNLPGILEALREGQRLRVDGTRGEVQTLD